MKIKKDSWHYKIRNKYFKDFCSVNAGREIDIDIKVGKIWYITEVLLSLYLIPVSFISLLISKFLILIRLADPLENLLSKWYNRKRRYIKFIKDRK